MAELWLQCHKVSCFEFINSWKIARVRVWVAIGLGQGSGWLQNAISVPVWYDLAVNVWDSNVLLLSYVARWISYQTFIAAVKVEGCKNTFMIQGFIFCFRVDIWPPSGKPFSSFSNHPVLKYVAIYFIIHHFLCHCPNIFKQCSRDGLGWSHWRYTCTVTQSLYLYLYLQAM